MAGQRRFAMPMIEVDFETFKEITARRPHEGVSEGDVVREAFGLSLTTATGTSGEASKIWFSEGVGFSVGTKLRHRFRGGRTETGEIEEGGVRVNGRVFPGLSPAAAYGAGHQANGWHFWEVLQPDGKWVKADALRNKRR
jgi:hypothetical protein